MKSRYILPVLTLLLTLASPIAAQVPTSATGPAKQLSTLVGEKLRYRVSFLWFSRIALGEISLQTGDRPGTYLATLRAETKGLAAFFTRDRVETFSTLMEEGPDGLLRPLVQTSDTRKGRNGDYDTRQTVYTYDFTAHKVGYSKTVNGKREMNIEMPMPQDRPVYDFLTAFYNLRLGRFGAVEVGRDIQVTAFSRKGPEKLVITGIPDDQGRRYGFDKGLSLCRVLLDKDTFKTKGKAVYVGFDRAWRPQRAVVPDVIGLGDVKGTLFEAIEPGRRRAKP